MKKRLYIGLGIAIIGIIGVLFGYKILFSAKEDLLRIVPRNATMLMRVNIADALIESDLAKSDLSQVFSKGGEAGIAYAQTHYIFVAQGYLGATLSLSDAESFATGLKRRGAILDKQRGLQWASMENCLIAFDNKCAIAMGPATKAQQNNLRNTLYQCMQQRNGEGVATTDLYKHLTQVKKSIAIAAHREAIPFSYGQELPSGDLWLLGGVSITNEHTTLDLQLEADGKIEQLLGKLDGVLLPIKHSFGHTIPEHSIARLEAGIHGEALLKLLREHEGIRTKLLMASMIFDSDMIIRSIAGDVCISMEKLDEGILQATITDNRFMLNIDSWNEGASESAGVRFLYNNKHHYCTSPWGDFYFSADVHTLQVTNKEDLLAKTNQSKDIENISKDECRLLLTFSQNFMQDFHRAVPFIDGIPELSFLQLSCTDAHHWSVAIQTSDLLNFFK